MADGIYPKYVVFKHPGDDRDIDREDIQLEEVDDFCFVLKPIKDKHARIAMAAYAESVKEEKPQLAKDLYEILGDY